MNKGGLSLVIPIFNEIGFLDNLVTQLRELLSGVNFPLEVILVDDGSKDGSGEKLDRIAGGEIRVIHHNVNRGYGATLKTGIRVSRFSYVAIADADGTYPNDRIPELYRLAQEKNQDMVVGARRGKKVNIPLVKRPPKWVLNRLANYLVKTEVPDLNSGLRVMKKETLEKYWNILPDGFSFTTTITLAVLKGGGSIEYVPIDYSKRVGRSKIRPIYDTLNFLQMIIRVVMYFDPLAVFLPLGLILMGLSFVVLFGSWYFLAKAMDVTFGVTLMTGVVLIGIGMLADFIDKRMR